MGEWIRIISVMLLAVLSLLAGLRISRLPKKWWLVGYFIPLVCLLLIGALQSFPILIFVAGFGWLVKGRMEFVLLATAIPMLFAILVPHVATKRLKVLLWVLLGISSVHFYLLPFLAPVFAREKISKLKTTIIDDICIQSTDYTCGPASAVTALRVFGIEGKESDIGVAAYTSPRWGTCDDLLADAMEKLHGDEGIECTYRYFKTIEEMKDVCPVIALVKYAPLIDHYVTVLEIGKNEVVVGDPLRGRDSLTYEAFSKKWRKVGIVVKQ